LFQKANETFQQEVLIPEQQNTVICDSFKFTLNNVIGKDEETQIYVIRHEYLKSDSQNTKFTNALRAHARLVDLFVEYEDVTGKKYFRPSQESYKKFETELLLESSPNRQGKR
jgi:hypothetical protein